VENKCHRSEAGHTNGTDIPQQVVKNILAKPGASTHDYCYRTAAAQALWAAAEKAARSWPSLGRLIPEAAGVEGFT